jgi:isoleucyl-tRNA synthetase
LKKFTPDQKILPWEIVATFKGKEIEGLEYEQLLPEEANSRAVIESSATGAAPFRILTGDFVTTEDRYRHRAYGPGLWRG